MDFYALSTLAMTSMTLQGNDLQIFLKLFSEEPESTEMEGTKESNEGNISIHVNLISICILLHEYILPNGQEWCESYPICYFNYFAPVIINVVVQNKIFCPIYNYL